MSATLVQRLVDRLIMSDQKNMTTKKDEPSPTPNQKMPSKKEEPPQAQQRIPSKKEEPSQAQQRVPSKKEEPSQAQQQKMPSKKEEPPQGQQQKMPSKKEEPPQGQQGDAATAAPGVPGAQGAAGPPVPSPGPQELHSRSGLKERATFFIIQRSDPSAVSQKGNEVNLTLGGIDLNNSGSVVVKADKKLLTVLFPDGRDGRAFTLKAETMEDLYEWKAALENALSLAPPSSAHVMGQNGIFGNDQADAVDGSKEPVNDKQPMRSTVIGRPILLALEDVDGSPTFLEKALRFVEEHGVKVEGILRQAADVEDVERRIREYEQGKIEFSSEEDAHVIGDCVKYVLRELPSSPVPASCCKALLEAVRTERSARVNAMRMAVLDTFPEPNRRLLQRILIMMQIVASNKAKNWMSSSAVAACMAPLLLRPLLAGDCEIENDFDVGGDGSLQLLQAAAAANHAQAIVITLLEEYDKIFGEGFVAPDLYSDSEESGSESEEATDDDESYEDDEDYEDDECDDATEESDAYNDDDDEDVVSGTGSESGHSVNNDLDDDKDSDHSSSVSESSRAGQDLKVTTKFSSSSSTSVSENDDPERGEDSQSSNSSATETNKLAELSKGVHGETKVEAKSTSQIKTSGIPKSTTIGNGPGHHSRRPTVWGRTSAKKNLSMESIDFPCDEEAEIEILEAEKAELQDRLTEEIEGNAILEARLAKRKKTLYERRLALEEEVARLEEELQRERDRRRALEAGLDPSQRPISLPETIDEKTKADLKDIVQAEADIINLNKKVDDLGTQLNQQLEQNSVPMKDSYNKDQAKMKDKKPKGSESAFERSRSKDRHPKEAECKNEKKQESSLGNKNPTENQQSDNSSVNKSTDLNAAETSAKKPLAKSASKKSTKSEKANAVIKGASSKTQALTKLTNRLNFLKQRRSQMANEVQATDKGRSSSQSKAVSSSDKGRSSSQAQPAPSSDKGKGPEPIPSVQNPEEDRGPDISQ
ncbi:hypothetical protein CCACVL1_30305 [Corchorus capsularis]|uniref:Rho-GAP domain-containing protein n=1 Tax=Corchorus capsularis TaxID=210143 RepID=A0A1R3FXY9_COCAP|nr:hypothetical protein CCACVL1_30305 [Corchorus capsularis]